jgi:hypothetical protein
MCIDGGCHCDNLHYTAEIDPARVVICHCTDCQSMSGSAFSVVAFTVEDGLKMTRGTVKIYIKTSADSGRPREHGFCPDCGTRLRPARALKSMAYASARYASATSCNRSARSGANPHCRGSRRSRTYQLLTASPEPDRVAGTPQQLPKNDALRARFATGRLPACARIRFRSGRRSTARVQNRPQMRSILCTRRDAEQQVSILKTSPCLYL